MTTPSGTIYASQINAEVGYPSNQTMYFSASRVRGLGGVYSNPMYMSYLRSKTWPPAFTTYSTAGSTTNVVIPSGRKYARVRLWGAGGSGGGGAEVGGGCGGSGAYVEAELYLQGIVNAGYSTFQVIVGAGATGGYGGSTSGAGGGGAGGGYTAFLCPGYTWLLIAGAGGGGGGSGQNAPDWGGAGGGGGALGATAADGLGGNNGVYQPGKGGTQSAGGAGGAYGGPGGQFYGGAGNGGGGNAGGTGGSPGGANGGTSGNGGGGGGGGGSGWFGGGGGNQVSGEGGSGGGGGSSYYNGSFTTEIYYNIAGLRGVYGQVSTVPAPWTGSGYIAGVGEGGRAINSPNTRGAAGGPGLVQVAFY